MKVTYGPLITAASGRFGGIVMTFWRGVNVCRRFRKPANPKSTDQVKVRYVFRNATRAWVKQLTETRNAWVNFASGKDFTGRNAYIAKQVPLLWEETDLTLMAGTPGDASTVGPYTPVITPGDTQLTVAVSIPTAPTGWTAQKVVVYCIKSVNWAAALHPVDQVEEEDATAPYECILTSLVNATLYRVFAFIVWTEPGGETRYSISSSADGTPSA